MGLEGGDYPLEGRVLVVFVLCTGGTAKDSDPWVISTLYTALQGASHAKGDALPGFPALSGLLLLPGS